MDRIGRPRRLAVAMALGAATVFLPHWDPADHWSDVSAVDHVVAEEASPDHPGGQLPWFTAEVDFAL